MLAIGALHVAIGKEDLEFKDIPSYCKN